MLPLMYILELQDVIFTVTNLKSPNKDFDLTQFLHFSHQGTRSSVGMKMTHKYSPTKHFFLNRIPRLWNRLPPIDLQQSVAVIKKQLHIFLYNHFVNNFDNNSTCSYHFVCPCSSCGSASNSPIF